MNVAGMLSNKSWSMKTLVDTDAQGSAAYLILNSMIMMSVTAYLYAMMSEFE